VKENYTKEMKLYIEEQLAVTMKELGYPEDVRLKTNTSRIFKKMTLSPIKYTTNF
jgi:hypothetical protein